MKKNLVSIARLWEVAHNQGISKYILAMGYSNRNDKKYYAVPRDRPKRKIHFGSADHTDFLITGDLEKRERYRLRHQHDYINNPLYPGWYSYRILWML
jgi:hypothetical protein